MIDDRVNIRLPPRVRLRIIDSATGSYPSIIRLGDPDFRGNLPVFFDDTKTIRFTTSTQINLPSTLPIGSMFLDSAITSSLITQGNVRKGIADEFAHFSPGEDISPFNESYHLELASPGRSDDFSATGSSIEDVGFGFSSRLSSKTKIVIDINPLSEYTAGIRNGGVYAFGPADTVPGNWNFNGTNNYPMMYYNFDKRAWEGIGRGIATSITGTGTWISSYLYPCNPTGSSVVNIREGMYGFSPSYGITASIGTEPIEGRQAAVPMANFGFPTHPKFHATGSQLLDMSRYISRPFLIEKMVYEFSASYKPGSLAMGTTAYQNAIEYSTFDDSWSGSLPRQTWYYDQSSSIGDTTQRMSDGRYGSPISTFFILNQRRPGSINRNFLTRKVLDHDLIFGDAGTFASTGNPDHVYPMPSSSLSINIPSATVLTAGPETTFVDTTRDLVTFAQVSTIGSDTIPPYTYQFTPISRKILSRDLNIEIAEYFKFGSDPDPVFWSGSFIMSASIRAPVSNTAIMPIFTGHSDFATLHLIQNIPGGRSGDALPTGRDLNNSIVGNEPTASYRVKQFNFSTTLTPGTRNFIPSPYILHPSDKLVFGWQVPMGKRMFAEGRTFTHGYISTGKASELTIHPGVGRLTLYGSQIKEGVEFHDTRNPPLTSVAIHEGIHSDNPVLDQFDTEPRQQFNGSYIGEYVTGSMLLTAEAFLNANRGRAASTIEGSIRFPFLNSVYENAQSDREGNYRFIPGFIRGVQLRSDNERYFDTITPRIDYITRINGGVIRIASVGGEERAYVTIGHLSSVDSSITDETWNRAFPFEPKYADAPRLLDGNSNIVGVDSAGNTKIRQPTLRRMGFMGTPNFANFVLQPHPFKLGYPVSGDEMLVEYFGFGDDKFHTGSVGKYDGLGGVKGQKPRGFKYGLMNVRPTFVKMIVRYDRYGQFRDILEQRLDAKFFDITGVGSRISPINIKFVERSSNLSTDPNQTFSSNLSTEATSSLPYFDGLVRNREEPLGIHLNSTIVTL